jgi:uncharacterized membrane protein YozB (DUF420 family)
MIWLGATASGFLTSRSSLGADITLILMLLAVAALTTGVFLARARHIQAHRWVQTAAVCLNVVLVVAWMIRSYARYVAPDLPGNLSKGVDAVTTVHAVVGAIGVAIGVFVVVRANQLMARGDDPGRYKTAMRTAYVVYVLAAALGVWVYVALYG